MGFLGAKLYKFFYNIRAYFISDAFKVAGWEVEKYKEIQKYLFEKLTLDKDDIILDFGCGSGIWAKMNAHRVKRIIGLEHLFKMGRRAMQSNVNLSNVQIIYSNSNKLPLKDNIFTKVVCCSVFQYFPDFEYAKQIMKEMFRVTKSGGQVFLFDIINRQKMIFPRYTSKDIFCPMLYSRKILQYYFTSTYSVEEILDYCNSKGMFPQILKDDRVFITDRDSFSCSIQVMK